MADMLATLVPSLGQALLHFVWQGALIGLLAALVLGSLGNARPQLRYAVACVALLVCVLAPIATLLLLLLPDVVATHSGSLFASPGGPEAAGGSVLSALSPTPAQLQVYLPAIVATWAAGTCLLSLRMALGLICVSRFRNAPQGPAQSVWQKRLNAIAVHFHLGRGVALRLVENLESPVSAGWWRPVVLLPAGLLTRMPIDLIEALLAHELAHIRRHDYLVNLLQNVIEAVLFYHPVVWWLSRRIRVEREQIADRLAAEVACAPRRLAHALSELSEIQRTVSVPMPATTPALPVMQAADGGPLMSRIQQLLRPERRSLAGARILFPLLGLVATSIATYTWAQAEEREPGITMRGTLHLDGKKRDDSFALVRGSGDEMHMWGSIDDIDAIKSARDRVTSDYLWFRHADGAYIVTDPGLLARAREATRATEEPDRKMEELEEQMEPHSRKMEVLEERMDALADDSEPTPRAVAAERQMEVLGKEQEELGRLQEELARQQRAADDGTVQAKFARQVDALAAKQDELGRRMDELSAVLDEESRRFEAHQAPMEALSREMELAGKPMEALSEQMEAQGRVLEEATARVERELRKLIDEAVARKLASPLPSA